MLKRSRYGQAGATALAVAALVLGCSGSDSVAPVPVPVASVLFSTDADSVVVGQTHQLFATTADANHRTLSGRSITWSVSDSTVAHISAQGVATGLHLGTTLVTARSDGISASQTLTVVQVPVARIAFASVLGALNVGDSAAFVATAFDASGNVLTDRVVSYSSTVPAVLSVSQTGVALGESPGNSTIVASCAGRSAMISVHVQALPVARIAMSPRTLDVATGASGPIAVRVFDARGNPANPSGLTYTSSNTGVMSFDASGRFVANAPGAATLSASSNGITTTLQVTVQTLQPGTFHFDLRFVGPPDPDIVAAAQRAAARWERVLPVALASQQVDVPAGACETLAPAISGTTTGIIVTIAKDSIDGRSRTLAEAGPCIMRSDGAFVAVGAVDLDSADVAAMVQRGTLENVIAHELGHVLGIGTIWDDGTTRRLLADTAGDDPRYIGAAAVHDATDIGFLDADSTRGVEVENVGGEGSRLGHWRESVYSTELMTSVDGPGNVSPLSRITVGSLHDLGFVTREAGADFFSAASAKSGGLSVSAGVSPSINVPLGPPQAHEVLRRPRFIITPSGRPVPLAQRGAATNR